MISWLLLSLWLRHKCPFELNVCPDQDFSTIQQNFCYHCAVISDLNGPRGYPCVSNAQVVSYSQLVHSYINEKIPQFGKYCLVCKVPHCEHFDASCCNFQLAEG
ncbi:hypothetical protein BC943DRAFT_316047 [Umbelopsis sp. AD052]|nr:hypothetical protein BC943DRAFT_316047 [Umbelopsis sp. AD052]